MLWGKTDGSRKRSRSSGAPGTADNDENSRGVGNAEPPAGDDDTMVE